MSETAEGVFALGAALAFAGAALTIGGALSWEWDTWARRFGLVGLVILIASMPVCISTAFY